MVAPIVVVDIALVLVALLAAAGYTYLDAPEYGMNPTRWAAIVALVPLFGLFAYLFERGERTDDDHDTEEMFVDGPFEIHRSRADDAPWAADADEQDEDDER